MTSFCLLLEMAVWGISISICSVSLFRVQIKAWSPSKHHFALMAVLLSDLKMETNYAHLGGEMHFRITKQPSSHLGLWKHIRQFWLKFSNMDNRWECGKRKTVQVTLSEAYFHLSYLLPWYKKTQFAFILQNDFRNWPSLIKGANTTAVSLQCTIRGLKAFWRGRNEGVLDFYTVIAAAFLLIDQLWVLLCSCRT